MQQKVPNWQQSRKSSISERLWKIFGSHKTKRRKSTRLQ